MKATLKHVANQYILIATQDTKTLGSPPIIGKWYLTQQGFKVKTWDLKQYTKPNILLKSNLVSYVYEVLASEYIIDLPTIIIQHKGLYLLPKKDIETLMQSRVDTEVEVTEEEDYYLIRL